MTCRRGEPACSPMAFFYSMGRHAVKPQPELQITDYLLFIR